VIRVIRDSVLMLMNYELGKRGGVRVRGGEGGGAGAGVLPAAISSAPSSVVLGGGIIRCMLHACLVSCSGQSGDASPVVYDYS
jgi:hypothetical protein